MTLNTAMITTARWRRFPAPLRADLLKTLGRRAQIINHQVLAVAQALCDRGAYDLALDLYQALDSQPAIPYQGCGLGLRINLRELMGAYQGPDPRGTIVLRL
jgi:hypothetical protein